MQYAAKHSTLLRSIERVFVHDVDDFRNRLSAKERVPRRGVADQASELLDKKDLHVGALGGRDQKKHQPNQLDRAR